MRATAGGRRLFRRAVQAFEGSRPPTTSSDARSRHSVNTTPPAKFARAQQLNRARAAALSLRT